MTEEKAFSRVERVPNCESRRRESIGQGLAGAIVIVAVVVVVVVLDVVIVVVVVFVSRGRKISIHI